MKAIKKLFKRIRHGNILNIVDEQTIQISELKETSVKIHNALFDERIKTSKDISEYHGPMQDLRNCKCIKADKPQSRLKDMIEVAEFNGYNGHTYYWYFIKEAKMIYEDIDYVPEKEEGTPYVPPNQKKRGQLHSDKTVATLGRKVQMPADAKALSKQRGK